MPHSLHEFLFFGPNGSLTPTGDLVIESREWRDQLFAQRASREPTRAAFLQRVAGKVNADIPGRHGRRMGGGQALNQLLVVMDGMGDPPLFRKFVTNRTNTFLDAMFVVPQRIGSCRCGCRGRSHGRSRSTSSAPATYRSRCSTRR